MTSDRLRQLHQARPFRQFTLYMADGHTISVEHPEFMAYAGGRTAVVEFPDETFEVIDLLLISSIKVGSGKDSKRRNGKGNGRK